MLRITIDLVPYGVEVNKSTLSQFEIVNTGSTSNPDTYIVRKDKDSPHLFEYKHYRTDGLNRCVEAAFSILHAHGLDKIE